jgi:hypothetical protein
MSAATRLPRGRRRLDDSVMKESADRFPHSNFQLTLRNRESRFVAEFT